MRGDAGKCKEIVEREIAVADRVQAIRGDFRKAKFAGNGGAVDREGISGQSAGTHGAGVGTRSGGFQARDIARECFRMREKKMREQNRLCVMPAMGTPSLALPWQSSALARATRPRLISDAASITKRRKSVATSSLRLR